MNADMIRCLVSAGSFLIQGFDSRFIQGFGYRADRWAHRFFRPQALWHKNPSDDMSFYAIRPEAWPCSPYTLLKSCGLLIPGLSWACFRLLLVLLNWGKHQECTNVSEESLMKLFIMDSSCRGALLPHSFFTEAFSSKVSLLLLISIQLCSADGSLAARSTPFLLVLRI